MKREMPPYEIDDRHSHHRADIVEDLGHLTGGVGLGDGGKGIGGHRLPFELFGARSASTHRISSRIKRGWGETPCAGSGAAALLTPHSPFGSDEGLIADKSQADRERA